MHTLYPDVNNAQSTGNPFSDRSRHCIQFTPTKVQSQAIKYKRSLYPLDNSSKTQLAFCIASKCYVHLWSDVQHLYAAMEMARNL